MDKEALKNRAVEIGLNLNLEGFSDEEIGVLALFKAVSESIGGIQNLETGSFPEEADLIKELTESEPFQRVRSRIVKK